MVSVPCVITTLPSNTLVFCTSSTRMRSDSRLIGLLRSARSACAGPANPRQQVQKTSALRGRFRITETASDIGEYEGMRPEGLDPPSSVPLDGRGESPLGGQEGVPPCSYYVLVGLLQLDFAIAFIM